VPIGAAIGRILAPRADSVPCPTSADRSQLLHTIHGEAFVINGPITFAIDGTQYVSAISGNSLVTFALRDQHPVPPDLLAAPTALNRPPAFRTSSEALAHFRFTGCRHSLSFSSILPNGSAWASPC
jgi:hypothetical protein